MRLCDGVCGRERKRKKEKERERERERMFEFEKLMDRKRGRKV